MKREKCVIQSFPAVIDWINENIHQGINAADVIRISGYSRSYFYANFNYTTALAFHPSSKRHG